VTDVRGSGVLGGVTARPRARVGGRRSSRERVLRPVDWSFPAPPVPDREVLSAVPSAPRPGRPPVLFVHGAALAAWCWERWLPMAADAGVEAHAVSLRGHGGSPSPGPFPRTPLRHYVHDVLQVITGLSAPPVLVGHSMGAVVVAEVLARYRAAPAGVLLCPAPPAHGAEVFGSLVRHDPGALLRGLANLDPRPSATTLFGEGTDPALAASVRDRLGEEATVAALQVLGPRRVPDVRCPLLVVGTEDDRVTGPWAAVRTARTFGTRAVLYRELGHLVMLDPAGDVVLDRLLRFVDDVATG
jgi:pimeloyl-ACP methyl ester carboxylesterase